MHLISVIMMAVALAMDAFSIAISKGLCAKKIHYPDAFKIAACFGIFQFGMPVVGWLIGSAISGFVSGYGRYISFGLLLFLGGKMIYEAITSKDENPACTLVTLKELIVLGIATSIDALTVGLTFAFSDTSLVSILLDCALIGIITAIISFCGYFLGQKLAKFAGGKAGIFGGIVLIIIGIKILITG